jgi:hypothetical protein
MVTEQQVAIFEQQVDIFLKGKAIIKSCVTPEHCVVAHNWIKLAERELEGRDTLLHNLNQTYLTKILQVTGVIE